MQNKPITSLCLNVTDACNFDCRYCFVNKQPNRMPFKVADDAVQWLLSNVEKTAQLFSTQNLRPQIFFFGGEPTLEWDTIIIPIVEKYKDTISYSITTNGFLLDEEKIDFLKENNFAVMLSMDGNEKTQSYNRNKDSFEKLDKMIPYLLDQIPSTVFRGTIIPATCEHTFDNILYAHNKGFKNCYFTINVFENWNEIDREKLELEMKKFTLAYINFFVNETNLINLTSFSSMLELIVKKEVGVLDNSINIYKCGLGNGYGAVDYKGDIYTCQEIVSRIDKNDIFCIGNIYSGININKQESLCNRIVNDLPMVNNYTNCENCPLIFCCKKNTCQTNNYLCHNHFLIQSYNACWWNQLLYKCAGLSISLLQNHPNFQEYMKNIVKKGD